MTTQELILGHYEGTLTESQQSELQGLLESSPETRALFDQHGKMQEAMEEESRKLAPPIALREATIVGALGVAAESIGGGLAAWFTAKVAAVVGSVVVVGTVVGVIATNNSGDSVEAGAEQTVPETEEVRAADVENEVEAPIVEETSVDAPGATNSDLAGSDPVVPVNVDRANERPVSDAAGDTSTSGFGTINLEGAGSNPPVITKDTTVEVRGSEQ